MNDWSGDRDCYDVLTSTDLENCKALCSEREDCNGIEINEEGTRCELWTSCTPGFSSHSLEYGCYVKATGIS